MGRTFLEQGPKRGRVFKVFARMGGGADQSSRFPPLQFREVPMRVLVTEFMAIVAIGDGIVGLLFPVRHTTRLAGQGPKPWRRAMRVFTKHPGLTRALGVV